MGGQILAPFIMAPNTVGCLSVYIWYEFAEVGFPWRQLLPSFQARLRGHSLGGAEDERRGLRPRGAKRFSGRGEQQKLKPASKAASTRRWPCTEGLSSSLDPDAKNPSFHTWTEKASEAVSPGTPRGLLFPTPASSTGRRVSSPTAVIAMCLVRPETRPESPALPLAGKWLCKEV
ncbi:bcl-2-related protein A1 isoform X5 [Pteropus medius]|uniref:bcl-2-related protein A1 isoform X5 n=1 Tax=Pteropus vampyrus TaxID=132908 RepID=UPI00196B77FD|nr:bcl-2-related protein A1 isoform X5 [Pteropus giganteus]